MMRCWPSAVKGHRSAARERRRVHVEGPSGMNSSRTNPRIHESFSSNSGSVEKSQAIGIPL